ncbi:MAG: hypothetical protein ABIZ05_10885 [Pseudonocardiaceae bacterium]
MPTQVDVTQATRLTGCWTVTVALEKSVTEIGPPLDAGVFVAGVPVGGLVDPLLPLAQATRLAARPNATNAAPARHKYDS